jgi:hypothetical protein
MKKLIKRKDGSYSKRGLWDNIRANKGSGKEPTKEMLKQESKIKKEESMNSMYKKGGKPSKKSIMKEARNEKESFMEESKELSFGAPGVRPPMKKKYAMGGKNGDPLKATTDSTAYFNNQTNVNFTKAKKASGAGNDVDYMKFIDAAYKSRDNAHRQGNKGKTGFDANGHPVKKASGGFGNGDPRKATSVSPTSAEPKPLTPEQRAAIEEMKNLRKPSNQDYKLNPSDAKKKYAMGGKSMEPGGGGRFEALVNKLKSKGKSEEAAEGIAASAGRAKYGKGKFQAMAAKGRKKG